MAGAGNDFAAGEIFELQQISDANATTSTANGVNATAGHIDKVKFKRTLSLLTGVGLILGQIIGAGIFASPKGVLLNTGSKGKQKNIEFNYAFQ